MREMIERQREFDEEHGWQWHDIEDVEEKVDMMQHAIVCMTEELGEIAGPIKKMVRRCHRDGFSQEEIDDVKEEVAEELADVQIYLMKLADLFGIDLEEEHARKVQKNWERFGKFKVEGEKK